MGEMKFDNALGVKGLSLAANGLFGDETAPADSSSALSLSISGKADSQIDVFDQPVMLTASAEAKLTATFHKPGRVIKDPFGVDQSLGPHQRWAELSIAGALRAAGSTSSHRAPYRLSASAMASTELEYQRLLPLLSQGSLKMATGFLIQGARVPGSFFDTKMEPGEWYRFAGRLRFGFDLQAAAGFDYQYLDVVDLFDGFSTEIKASAEATVMASLGLSLFESTEIVVSRPFDSVEGLRRLRIARVKDRGVTFGAKMSVAQQSNLGTVLTRTLDHVFATEPIGDVLAAWKEIASYSESKTWDALKDKLSKKASDTVIGLFRRHVDLGESDTIDRFLGKVAEFVKTYDELDERIQDLWADLLEHAGLGGENALQKLLAPLADLAQLNTRAKILEEIAKLNQSLEGRATLQILELLTGESLESLISSPLEGIGGLQKSIEKVAADAKKLADLIAVGPGSKIVKVLQKYAQETGIAGIIEVLRSIPASGNLAGSVLERPLRKVVARLFHKAWEHLEGNEIALLRKWAEKVAAEFEKFKEWEKKLRQDLARLDKKVGFSLAIEVSRQFHQEAFLDVGPARRRLEQPEIQEGVQLRGPARLHETDL